MTEPADPPAYCGEPRFAPLVQFLEQGIPFNRHLGLRVILLDPGRAVCCVPWADHLIGDALRPAIHGGVTSMLIDTTGGCACFTQMMKGSDRMSTLDLRVDYLRPLAHADTYCQAQVMRLGNRVGVCRMEVFAGRSPWVGGAADALPVATGQGVYNLVRKGD